MKICMNNLKNRNKEEKNLSIKSGIPTPILTTNMTVKTTRQIIKLRRILAQTANMAHTTAKLNTTPRAILEIVGHSSLAF
jgi:hypothetical protein